MTLSFKRFDRIPKSLFQPMTTASLSSGYIGSPAADAVPPGTDSVALKPTLRPSFAVLTVLLACSAMNPFRSASGQAPPSKDPGIANTKPDKGRFVEDNGRYLVPYAERLPGSSVSFELIPIPGGVFRMGSPIDEENRRDDEALGHRVRVQPFWIGKHEVTWSEYRRFMELYDLFKSRKRGRASTTETANQVDAVTAPTPLYDPTFTFALGEEPSLPAVTMTQFAARQYTKWLSKATGKFYRLPTEAEWEYACRAGSSHAFSFGNEATELDAHAWYFENSDDTVHEVGGKRPNAWGLHDMHGNVAEMVLDEYSATTHVDDREHAAGLPISVSAALRWPTKMFGRVVRGGSWNSDAEQLRCAARDRTRDWRSEDPNFPKSPWWYTDEQAQCVGFRVVRALEVPPVEEHARYWDADTEDLRADVQHRLEEGRGVIGTVKMDQE